MFQRLLAASAVAALISTGAAAPAIAADPPISWDNLVQVPARSMMSVYLLPGADFRIYSKVMLDPTEVDFVPGWVRDANRASRSARGRTSDRDAERIAAAARTGFDGIWTDAFTRGGWQVVTAPGPDVLRISPVVFNLSIAAPGNTTGRVTIRTVDAGQASLLLVARDSETGAVLGRGLDAQRAGENSYFIPRSTTTNTADFRQMFQRWATLAVRGLDELKTLSPVGRDGAAVKK